MVVIAARGQESCVGTKALHHLETENAAVEGNRSFQVANFQMDCSGPQNLDTKRGFS